MNIFLISFALTFVTISQAGDFYSDPNQRFYYSYHPFRPQRDVKSKTLSQLLKRSENLTEPKNMTNLVIEAPVTLNQVQNTSRPNIKFAFKGGKYTNKFIFVVIHK